MRLINFIPVGTKIKFMQAARLALIVSSILCVGSVVIYLGKGLNLGIDFRGGILIEIRTQGPADLEKLRATLIGLRLGEVQLQEFGRDTDVLVGIESQPGGAQGQKIAVDKIKQALPKDIDYRRTEFVGPKVSGELSEAGVTAVALALVFMLIYIWFRFEWQFGVGAVVALSHDVLLTIGIFALLGLEFNLSTVAAILTIAGYSINDTVVVYDRVRENLRKYKKLPIVALLTRSINDTLSRTMMTSITTLLALVALYLLGGAVIADFSFAMIWGVLIGTYSSIFIAAPLLILMNVRQAGKRAEPAEAATADTSRDG